MLAAIALLAGCAKLEPADSALTCNGCLPACAADVDPDDLAGTARRLGCDPQLVVSVNPTPGWVVRDANPEITVELRAPVREPSAGRGCDGPIRLSRMGRVGDVPQAVAADIVTHASLHSLPLWPSQRDCVDASWSLDGRQLRLSPMQPLDSLVWYEVDVSDAIELGDARLCSQLSWRFTVSACGDGTVQTEAGFTDWVCLGKVEADQGWFDPYNEQCDDGNRAPQDGCSPTCIHETGWTCDAGECHTRCGDGVIAGQEQCDFGVHGRKGCDADCQIEPGFSCGAMGCAPIGDGGGDR